MTVRALSTLKTNMPIGTPGGTSAQDIHDFAESTVGVLPYVGKTATYSAADDDETIACDASGGAITINLPACASARAGKVYIIKKTDNSINAVVVDGNSSETIDGDTTQILFTQNAFVAIQNTGAAWIIIGQRGVLSGAIYVMTTNSAVVNTATETTIIAAGVGNLTLPANFFRVGRVLRILASGDLSDSGGSINIRVKLGSTTVVSTGSIATVGTLAQNGYFMETLLTCRAVGASGSVHGAGHFSYDTTTGELLGMRTSSSAVINTTASQVLSVTAQWAAADPSRRIDTSTFMVEIAA